MSERLVVVLRLTEACNLSCGFCAYDRKLARSRTAADPARVLAFGRALAAGLEGREVLVSFLGGEPLLWPALAGIEHEFRALGLGLGVTTNGVALAAEATRERLLERYAELTVSIDGLGKLHDELRGWPGGFERLKMALRALSQRKRALARGPLLRVNTVLMRDNVESFGALCHELADWGVEQVTFNQLGGNDRPEFHAEHRLLPEHVELLSRKLPVWRRELGARGLELRGGPDYLARFAASATGRKLPVANCAPGERFWFVSQELEVSPCSFSSATYTVELRELGDLRTLPARFAAQRRQRRLTACADCPSTQVFAKYAE